jgi:hypothetical protein
MHRITLVDLGAARELSATEMGRAAGGWYAIPAGIATTLLAWKYRKQIWNKIKPKVQSLVPSALGGSRPKSTNCVTWYDGTRNCY